MGLETRQVCLSCDRCKKTGANATTGVEAIARAERNGFRLCGDGRWLCAPCLAWVTKHPRAPWLST
jgi:hypothetical protein